MREELLAGGEACRRAEDAFFRCIREHRMEPLLARGVLLALSGGADSVLLFHLLNAYTKNREIPFAACHVHHGIRGEEAERDAAFCEQLAAEHGVPFFLAREDAPAYLAKEGHGKGMEYAAREVRYAALSRVMTENAAYVVCATAHNATDHLETLLLHMRRGSGLRGMCGIPPVRMPFVRPLLLLSKRDVLAALGELGASYVTDSTNESTAYDRNYLRAEVLPRLSHLTPDPEAAAARLSQNLREEESAICRAKVCLARHFALFPRLCFTVFFCFCAVLPRSPSSPNACTCGSCMSCLPRRLPWAATPCRATPRCALIGRRSPFRRGMNQPPIMRSR